MAKLSKNPLSDIPDHIMHHSPISQLVLATHNKGKRQEFEQALTGLDLRIMTADAFNLAPPAETGATFLENARIKARAVFAATGCAALADDSGLCVNALAGRPGVASADWEGDARDPQIAITRLHNELKDQQDWSAYFACTLVLIDLSGNETVFEGRCDGNITNIRRGQGGHGYDPVFIPQGFDRTFAEMSVEEKNSLSHRGIAIKLLRDFLFRSSSHHNNT